MRQGIHILLADDETGFCFSASVALRGAGYRVTVAKDGREAFARIVEARAIGDPVQILVTDQQMPGMTGMELVTKLYNWGIKIPAVVVTAHHNLSPGPGPHRGIISELIEKPIEPEDLVACLKRVAVPALNPA
jgi:DNA-binding NtrC family response regulator